MPTKFLICFPWSDPRSRRIPGADLRTCCDCEQPVGVSPASLELELEATIICQPCAQRRQGGRPVQIQPLSPEQAAEIAAHLFGAKEATTFDNLPGQSCPACGNSFDRAGSHAGHTQAKPRDLGVCTSCGHICSYDDNLRLRSTTEAELRHIARKLPTLYGMLTDLAAQIVLRNPLGHRVDA